MFIGMHGHLVVGSLLRLLEPGRALELPESLGVFGLWSVSIFQMADDRRALCCLLLRRTPRAFLIQAFA